MIDETIYHHLWVWTLDDDWQSLESVVDASVGLDSPAHTSGPGQSGHQVDGGRGEDPHALHAEGDQQHALPGALLPHQPHLAIVGEGSDTAFLANIFVEYDNYKTVSRNNDVWLLL